MKRSKCDTDRKDQQEHCTQCNPVIVSLVTIVQRGTDGNLEAELAAGGVETIGFRGKR